MTKNTFHKSTTNDEFKFIDDEIVSYYASNNLLLNSNYIYWCSTIKTYGYDDGSYVEQVTSLRNVGALTLGDDVGAEIYFRLNNKNGDNVFTANSVSYTGSGYFQITGYLKTDIIRPITTNAINIYPNVDGTAMSLLISPTSAGWAATNSAQINLGNTSHYIKAVNGSGVTINASNAITLSGSAVSVSDSTATTSNSTGSLKTAGGISSSNSMDASSITNGGSLTLAGGAAINKKLYVGTSLNLPYATANTFGLVWFDSGIVDNGGSGFTLAATTASNTTVSYTNTIASATGIIIVTNCTSGTGISKIISSAGVAGTANFVLYYYNVTGSSISGIKFTWQAFKFS